MATTATATTGGLETMFKQDSMYGIPLDPETILTVSVLLSMKQGQKDLLDTEFLNFRYCLNVTIFKYLIPINQLPDLGY